jgi:hypothetical protein
MESKRMTEIEGHGDPGVPTDAEIDRVLAAVGLHRAGQRTRIVIVDGDGQSLHETEDWPPPGNLVDAKCGLTVARLWDGELVLLVNVEPDGVPQPTRPIPPSIPGKSGW